MWNDADGATIFLWVNRTSDRSHLKFVLDQARFVTRQNSSFWCFLDAQRADRLEFQSQITHFFLLKFVRRRIEFPIEDYGDGIQVVPSFFHQQRRRGGFKIVYCSIGGAGVNQEEVRTYLIYISPDGRCFSAAHDLGHEGAYPHGGIGTGDGFEFNIIWKPQSVSSPFDVRFAN